MYQNEDMINNISVEECFKNLIELAWETKKFDPNLANKFFDILVECLGVDFRISFNIDKTLTNNQVNLVLNNFYNASSGVNALKSFFKNFSYMVHEGKFSEEYLTYLLNRREILSELIEYQNLKASQDEINKESEIAKLATLKNDINLLDNRIDLVRNNLDGRTR